MTIQNPFGSLGYAPQVLPDMTAEIRALQRSELEQRRKDIAAGKKQAAENEKKFAELASFDAYDFMRQKQAQSFADNKEEFLDKMTSLHREYGTKLPIDKQIELQNEKNKILRTALNEKAFIEGFGKMQSEWIDQESKFKDTEQREQFRAQIASLHDKIKDPTQEVGLQDLMIAPPEPPAFRSLDAFSEELRKRGGSYDVTPGGKIANEAETKRTIKEMLQSRPSLVETGKIATGTQDIDQLTDWFYETNRGDLTKQERLPAPKTGTEKERFGYVVSEEITSLDGKTTGQGVKITKVGVPLNVRLGVGEVGKQGFYEFTPVQVIKRDGEVRVEGQVDVEANETLKVDLANLALMKAFGISTSKAKPAGEEDGKKMFEVTVKNSGTVPVSLNYNKFKEELEQKMPGIGKAVGKAPIAKTTETEDPLGIL